MSKVLNSARLAFLVAAATLMFVMLFATDVIAETMLTSPLEALGLAALALAAISMAGNVVTSMPERQR